MNIKAKLRPFYVAKMLYEQTDEDHYLTIAQIMEQLEKESCIRYFKRKGYSKENRKCCDHCKSWQQKISLQD